MVCVKMTKLLRLGNPVCHGYNNKHVFRVSGQSWLCLKKKQNKTKHNYNNKKKDSCLLSLNQMFCRSIHNCLPPAPIIPLVRGHHCHFKSKCCDFPALSQTNDVVLSHEDKIYRGGDFPVLALPAQLDYCLC